MFRMVRQLAALTVALALVAGSLLPPSLGSVGVAQAAVAAGTHDAMPCHGDPDCDTAQPCPFVAVCAAKCFQAVPSVTAAITEPVPVALTHVTFADQSAEGLSPAPLPKVPRA